MASKTDEEKKIEARKKLIAKALTFGIVFSEDTTDEDLSELIKNHKSVNPEKIDSDIILRNTDGKEVSQKDYFYSIKGEDTAPAYFNKMVGMPVDDAEMIEVFNRIFNPSKGVLFYKQYRKEVYIVIVPLKYSVAVGTHNDSIDGDHERHAISFIGEGSVNLDTLKQKLTRVASTIDLTDK